jgi:uncharacterized coiled-coil protein SlyX
MYNNPYSSIYSPQVSIDRINSQISELEKMKSQLPPTPIPQNPTNLTQNFQIAPSTNTNSIRYATSIDEVERDVVVGDTPYFSKDLSVVWIKNTKGEIKSYELNEIVQKDEKDLMIESLQMQLKELTNSIKEMKENAKSIDKHDDEPIEIEEPPSISVPRTSKTKSK